MTPQNDTEIGGSNQYEDALCPGCGTILTGSREPGDQDYCWWVEREVTLGTVIKDIDIDHSNQDKEN